MRISIDDVWCGRAIGLDWHGLGFWVELEFESGLGFAIGIAIGLTWLGHGSFDTQRKIRQDISPVL